MDFVKSLQDKKIEEIIVLSDDDDDDCGNGRGNNHSSISGDKLDLGQQVLNNSFTSEMKLTLSVSLNGPVSRRSSRNSVDQHSTTITNHPVVSSPTTTKRFPVGKMSSVLTYSKSSLCDKKPKLLGPKIEPQEAVIKGPSEKVELPVKTTAAEKLGVASVGAKLEHTIQKLNFKHSSTPTSCLSFHNAVSNQLTNEEPKNGSVVSEIENKQPKDVTIIESEKLEVVEALLQLCRTLAKDDTDHRILTGIQNRLLKCDSDFLNSEQFHVLTGSVRDKILQDTANIHYYLKEYVDGIGCAHHKVKSILAYKEIKGENPCTSSSNDAPDNDHLQARHILKLERLLVKCSKKIQKYEEKEMSLDDLEREDSTYIKIDLYKKKVMKIWNLLCKISKRSNFTGRVVEKKFKYQVSRFPEINQAITRLINRSKEFPDFSDVHRVVNECNDKYGLNLHSLQLKSIATDIFHDVGKELKRRRILDYEEHFGCRVDETQIDNDPADNNPELSNILKQRDQERQKEFDEVISAFVEKQVKLEIQGSLKEEKSDEQDEPPPIDVMNESADEYQENESADEYQENESADEYQENESADDSKDGDSDGGIKNNDGKAQCDSDSDSSEIAGEDFVNLGVDDEDEEDNDSDDDNDDDDANNADKEDKMKAPTLSEPTSVPLEADGVAEENETLSVSSTKESLTSLPLKDSPCTSNVLHDEQELSLINLPDLIRNSDGMHHPRKHLLTGSSSGVSTLLAKRQRFDEIEMKISKSEDDDDEVITLN